MLRDNICQNTLAEAWTSNLSVKVSGEYIGAVTPNGVIPKRGAAPVVKTYCDYEFGATYFLYCIAGDLVEVLAKHFGKESAAQIWSIAALRLVTRCPFRAVQIKYEKSWISRQFPDLPLSRSNMTNILQRIGNDRAACAAFMRETMLPAPQVSKIYIMSSDGEYGYPGFYRNVDGNTPDVSAMVLTMKDADIKKAIVLGDAGFGSDGNYNELSDPCKELDYIIPLRRNTSEINAGEPNDTYGDEYLKTVKYGDVFTYNGRAIDAYSEVKDGYRICVFRDAKQRRR